MENRRTDLVERHLPLVEQVVLRVSGSFPRFVDRSELVSAGMLGLVEAADRFDFDRGVPFAGYAIQRIRGAVLDVARSEDWSPRSTRQLSRRVEDVTQDLAREHRCAPDDRQIATRLGVGVDELRRMRERINSGMVRALDSRQELDRGEDDDHMVDRTVPGLDELLEDREMHGYLRAALDSLTERHRTVVVGLYLEKRSFEELAELLGVTPSRISQLRADAIEIIRHGIDSQFGEHRIERPKGRVEIRQARFAAEIASNSDFRSRLTPAAWGDRVGPAARCGPSEPMPVADVPETADELFDQAPATRRAGQLATSA
jgi:RNA polymerase sigma factor for flagellar operon FliA